MWVSPQLKTMFQQFFMSHNAAAQSSQGHTCPCVLASTPTLPFALASPARHITMFCQTFLVLSSLKNHASLSLLTRLLFP